jgi:hypothetical protein
VFGENKSISSADADAVAKIYSFGHVSYLEIISKTQFLSPALNQNF